MNVYLAGGAVRDLLLGNPIADRDYLVMNTTRNEFQSAFPNAQEVGRTFPVFLIDKQEFSFPRASTVDEELKARDLTVNAMLLDHEGNLICHPKSLHDLKHKKLRPASDSSFTQDPLRVFRAARFWARFPDFTPHDELIRAMQKVAATGLLQTISADRIGQETIKALSTPSPGNYLRLLSYSYCLSPWLEEFKESFNIPAGPPKYHDSNVMEHTAQVMDRLAGNPISVWMGLCHDIGKNQTSPEDLPKHYGHDKNGESMAKDLAIRIRLSKIHMTAGMKASRWHMIAAQYDSLRPGTQVDLLMDLHLSRNFSSLFRLVEADHGVDFLDMAKEDLKTILSISLPKELFNKGAESGIRLRAMRAGKLASMRKK